MKTATKWLMILLPVLYCVGMQSMVVLDASYEFLFGFLGGYLLLGLIATVLYSVLTRLDSPASAVKANIWILASNLLVFACCLILLTVRFIENRIAEENGAMEGGLLIFLLIVVFLPHWLTYLMARIAGAVCCSKKWPGRKVHGELLGVLSLIPVADLIIAIILLRKVNPSQRCQQPPIAT